MAFFAWFFLHFASGPVVANTLVRGVDVSSLPQVEDGGGIFLDGGVPGDALEILAAGGADFVRLRIWHSPSDGYCGLERTMEMAARARALGLGVLLDFHYSDTWADPGKQLTPAAWEALSAAEIGDSVYRYTRDVIEAHIAQDTRPDWVQIGNEITCGLLWDKGRVCGPHDTPDQWDKFASIVQAGLDGARDAAGEDSITTIVHIADGCDNRASIGFYDNLIARGVEFDLIGLSFYPWWHGTLAELGHNIRGLAARYGKGIVIVETAYPFTLGWDDETHNGVGLESQLHEDLPATGQGQLLFLESLADTLLAVPGGLGIGFFYWEPAWVAAPSSGSPWENLSIFDFDGELLPSIKAFERPAEEAEN